MKVSKNTASVFFSLLRAGLWEKGVHIESPASVDYYPLAVLAVEQSVPGIVYAGLGHLEGGEVPRKVLKYFEKRVEKYEAGNQLMNFFIALLVDQMKDAGIRTLLVKGQGIARCYERPGLRAPGDIDFVLDRDNYRKAKEFLIPMASAVEMEGGASKHLGLEIEPWYVELHGTLRTGLSVQVDRELDRILTGMFAESRFRVWDNDGTEILLPCVNDDVLYVFTHILQHFYRGGVGLKQVCDWCRQLWVYREEVDVRQLRERLHAMHLESEWRAFAALAVEYLGMPEEAMPLYDRHRRWKRKARRIQSFILKVGNLGQNRDMSYYGKSFLVRKAISMGQRLGDLCRHALIFPLDSLRFLPAIVFNGLRSAAKGEG